MSSSIPDTIPTSTLFLRQAKEQGLRIGALVGHGAGYGVYDKLKESLGSDVNYFFNVDPISIWLVNQEVLAPQLPPVIKLIGGEQHLCVHDRGIAAGDQEIWWDRRRGAAQGGARGRPARGRDNARFRRQV